MDRETAIPGGYSAGINMTGKVDNEPRDPRDRTTLMPTLVSHIDAMARLISIMEERVAQSFHQANYFAQEPPQKDPPRDRATGAGDGVLMLLRDVEERLFALATELARQQHRLGAAIGNEGPR